MVTNVLTGMVQGVEGILVRVEADVSSGLPMVNLFGSLAPEVREGKERVRTALKNTGISLPPSRITINLAPGDIRKSGTSFDLAIAVALFMAMKLIPCESGDNILFLGELSLDGSLLPVKGVLPILICARKQGIHTCFVPDDNLEEASLLEGVYARGFHSLQDVYQELKFPFCPEKDVQDKESLPESEKQKEHNIRFLTRNGLEYSNNNSETGDSPEYGTEGSEAVPDLKKTLLTGCPDFSEVKGQPLAKRALEIAVAGFHNVLLDGPPGVGKSMVASCVPGIMPEMTMEEKIDTTMIYSVKGLLGNHFFLVENRPFRAPSHNITMMGMFGGGSDPVPGEISLAHHGVLFLDEFPEYKRDMLEMLRVPLEEHRMILIRNNRSMTFPADFILIAASNPCPCGYYPDRSRCRCSNREIIRYHNRISGPIRDRIDLFVRCEEVGFKTLTGDQQEESSESVRRRVTGAWEQQRFRSDEHGYRFNGRMSSADVSRYCSLTKEGERMLSSSFHRFGLSGRGYYRVLKVARTIADLEGDETISTSHLEEALLFRNAVMS